MDYIHICLENKCLKSLAGVQLCSHKIFQLFSWPGLKGWIRIRLKSFRIHNTAQRSGSWSQKLFCGPDSYSAKSLDPDFAPLQETRQNTSLWIHIRILLLLSVATRCQQKLCCFPSFFTCYFRIFTSVVIDKKSLRNQKIAKIKVFFLITLPFNWRIWIRICTNNYWSGSGSCRKNFFTDPVHLYRFTLQPGKCGGAAGICSLFYDSAPSGTYGTISYLVRAACRLVLETIYCSLVKFWAFISKLLVTSLKDALRGHHYIHSNKTLWTIPFTICTEYENSVQLSMICICLKWLLHLSSVADPGCLSRIPDLGSRGQKQQQNLFL